MIWTRNKNLHLGPKIVTGQTRKARDVTRKRLERSRRPKRFGFRRGETYTTSYRITSARGNGRGAVVHRSGTRTYFVKNNNENSENSGRAQRIYGCTLYCCLRRVEKNVLCRARAKRRICVCASLLSPIAGVQKSIKYYGG